MLGSHRPSRRSSEISSRAIPPALQELIDDDVIDGVVCPLKSGKEADLYVVERQPYHYVAKVYRERRFRSFKNDAGYREGRAVRNTRSQRAIDKGTRFGRELSEQGWYLAEVEALSKLERAGARVPRILIHEGRVLIMELIATKQGRPAPQLAQVPLSPEGALQMYDAILEQVVLMLSVDLVHGDLSPYNVLIRDDGPVLIDMPQCVSAAHNKQAGRLLERDVKAITRHLGLIEPRIRDMGRHAWQLWAEYEGGTLTPEFRPDPERKRSGQVGDIEGLVDFVKTSATEGDLERRAAEGDADARALLRAADRRAARAERRADEYKRAAEEVLARAEERKNPKKKTPKGAEKSEGKGKAGKRGRGRGRGKKSGGRNADAKKSGRSASAKKSGRSTAQKKSAGRKAEARKPRGSSAPKSGGKDSAEGKEGAPRRRRRRRRPRGGGKVKEQRA